MRRVMIFLALIMLPLFGPMDRARAQVDIGMSIGQEGLKGFYLGVGEYFRVPQREVIIIRERHIPVEEIPVVLLIAQRARVAPASIINLRLGGKSWLDITVHYGLSPEIYYVHVPATVRVGPPYGKAYGHYKNKPKKEWKTIVLRDDEVINLVNLKFVSEHYGHPAEEVIKLRSKGKNFVVINHEIRKAKGNKHEEFAEHREENQKGMGHQKGKGHEKGKGPQKSKE